MPVRAAVIALIINTFTECVIAADLFGENIIPMFRSHCVVCHMPGADQGDLDLHPRSAFENLVDVVSTQSSLKRVVPGDPDNSYLYVKLLGTQAAVGGSGERMPFGEPQLSSEQLEWVRRWIVELDRP